MKVGVADPIAGGVTCGNCGAPVPADQGTCGHCNAALLTRRCPSCAATSPEGSKHCCRCGQALVCQGLRPLPADASCPRCSGELGLRVLPQGSLVECLACNGVWLEPEQLVRMTREAAVSAGPGSEGDGTQASSHPMAYLPCVRCGQLMVRRQFRWGDRATRIVLDYCGDHGVWLDGGELEAVLAHARAAGPAAGEAPSVTPPAAGKCSGSALEQSPGAKRPRSIFSAFMESVVEIFTEDIL
jgi:Zn-finger nucleic acid-binding protein